jgi:hypothetical protein
MARRKETAGRPRLSPAEKAKSHAARAYRAYLDTFSSDFIHELGTKRIQFAESRHRMGRPPKTVSQHRAETESKWLTAWEKYKTLAEEAGETPETPEQLKEYKKADKPGRRTGDDVMSLLKYIRRTRGQLRDIEATPKEEFDKAIRENRHGRPPMSKAEKITHYKNRIDEAQKEADELIAEASEADRIYYRLNELRVERRQLRLFIKDPNSPQVVNMDTTAEQAQQKTYRLNSKIKKLEEEHEEALERQREQERESAPAVVLERPQTQEELDRRYNESMQSTPDPIAAETRTLKERNARIQAILEREREKRRETELRKEAEALGIDLDDIAV